ncbi:ABC transporter ATP-binding protein, partial [human gut metagenome]
MMTSAKDDLYEILNNNRSMEEDQKNLKHQISRNNREQSYAKETYTDIVKKFSHSDKLFVSELLPSVEKIISQVDLEGKDIPGVTSDTIDWLLENKICLCGEELVEGEKHYEALKKLREEVYPNKIGGPAKLLKEKLNIWANDSKNLLEDIKEKGNSYEVCLDEIEDSENEIHRLESRIDKKLN